MGGNLSDLLHLLVTRGWAKLDHTPGLTRVAPAGPWWSIDIAQGFTTVELHPWSGGLLDFSLNVLVDPQDHIQSFQLDCNAMPVPAALINWWSDLDGALTQASWLRDQLIASWDREISAGGDLP